MRAKFVKMSNVGRYFSNLFLNVIFFGFGLFALFFSSVVAKAQALHPEVRRTRGFEEYKRQKKLLEVDRDKGLAAHLETVELEKREYEAALEAHRRQKKKEKPLEYTPAYTEKKAERREDQIRSEKDLESFRAEKKAERKLLEQAHLNKMEELGLPEDRPRFDLNKRALYGATTSFGKSKSGGGSGFGGGSPGGFSAPDSYSPPPPSSFDEFPPPPTFPDDSFDLPPPPPPPPMPFDDGMGMSAPFDEFPPPPPPPVDDFQF